MRSYASQLVEDSESHNVCSVLCARAQAFSDQVNRAGSSAGRRAKFTKLMKKQELSRFVYTTRFVRYLPVNGRLRQVYEHQPELKSVMRFTR